jgi:hypothetical protein
VEGKVCVFFIEFLKEAVDSLAFFLLQFSGCGIGASNPRDLMQARYIVVS